MQGVVSFSDPSARTTAAGALVFAGHLGTIYAAHNATYVGRALCASGQTATSSTRVAYKKSRVVKIFT